MSLHKDSFEDLCAPRVRAGVHCPAGASGACRFNRRGIGMNTIGFENCDIQGRESVLVVDHDHSIVREVIDAAAFTDWLDTPSDWLDAPQLVLVDLIPSQIEALRIAFPGATLRVYRNAIPHQMGAEEIRRLEKEYGDISRNMGAQRHIAAVRYAFDERQLSIPAGKLTLRFVTQDLKLSKDKIDYLNQLFDFCQHFLLPDPALRVHVDAFLRSKAAGLVPETAGMLRRYRDEICPEGVSANTTPVYEPTFDPLRPLHLIRDTWLEQVKRGDEESDVSYQEVVEKILAYREEE